jgi:3-hydroxymyristoyl/3-hydroxydecanoyl-(acyl carrier protein) dehydratase
MSARFEALVAVPAEHPALPGHFPGAPVVPGVVLLDRLLAAAEEHLGRTLAVRGLGPVKFLAPLRPGCGARAVMELGHERLTFRVELGAQLITQGTFWLAPGDR